MRTSSDLLGEDWISVPGVAKCENVRLAVEFLERNPGRALEEEFVDTEDVRGNVEVNLARKGDHVVLVDPVSRDSVAPHQLTVLVQRRASGEPNDATAIEQRILEELGVVGIENAIVAEIVEIRAREERVKAQGRIVNEGRLWVSVDETRADNVTELRSGWKVAVGRIHEMPCQAINRRIVVQLGEWSGRSSIDAFGESR